MKEKICLDFKGNKIDLDLKVCNAIEKFIGLMFCRREKAQALLFKFKNLTGIKIHSWFVFFPFVAIWLDDKNKIIEVKVVKCFRFAIAPRKNFLKLVEIPINRKYESVINSLVGKSEKFK